MIKDLLEIVTTHAEAILARDLAVLNAPPFAGYSTHTSPNGSTVITVELVDAARSALPPDQRRLDLFLLDANSQLGRHYHRHANAHIHIIRGRGVTYLDGVETTFAPGDATFFPAMSVHDVRSFADAVLFASFQDNPITQPDGSVDYFAAP